MKNHSTESGKILQDKFFISRWRRSGCYGDRRQRENKKFRRKIAESLFQTRFSKLILERVIDIERMNSYKKWKKPRRITVNTFSQKRRKQKECICLPEWFLYKQGKTEDFSALRENVSWISYWVSMKTMIIITTSSKQEQTTQRNTSWNGDVRCVTVTCIQ